MKLLNLGCGSRFHPDWENVDFVSASPAVRQYDLRNGVPYGDASFDVVYHSHILEHFPRRAAAGFMRECYRVLKPGGVIRVAVPDLERIATLYLQALANASAGDQAWRQNYDWILLEMYDQTVREESCGGCADHLRQTPIPNWDFVVERWGTQAKLLLEFVERQKRSADQSGNATAWKYALAHPFTVFRNKMLRTLLGPDDWKALQLGRFRRGGEIHMWMYDRYSLSELLRNCGFANPQQRGAAESQIPNWREFNLDTEVDGVVYKPDSLFFEATKL